MAQAHIKRPGGNEGETGAGELQSTSKTLRRDRSMDSTATSMVSSRRGEEEEGEFEGEEASVPSRDRSLSRRALVFCSRRAACSAS